MPPYSYMNQNGPNDRIGSDTLDFRPDSGSVDMRTTEERAEDEDLSRYGVRECIAYQRRVKDLESHYGFPQIEEQFENGRWDEPWKL